MGKLEGVLDNVLGKIFQDDRREEKRKEKLRRDLVKNGSISFSSSAFSDLLPPSPLLLFLV